MTEFIVQNIADEVSGAVFDLFLSILQVALQFEHHELVDLPAFGIFHDNRHRLRFVYVRVAIKSLTCYKVQTARSLSADRIQRLKLDFANFCLLLSRISLIPKKVRKILLTFATRSLIQAQKIMRKLDTSITKSSPKRLGYTRSQSELLPLLHRMN